MNKCQCEQSRHENGCDKPAQIQVYIAGAGTFNLCYECFDNYADDATLNIKILKDPLI